MEQVNNRSDIVWIDNARAISCILVIVTHVLGPWIYQLQQLDNINQFFLLFFFTISKLCTPTFLMISGSLLIQKEYKDLNPHKKRTKRLVNTFMIWSLVYLIFYTLLNVSRGSHYTASTYFYFVKDSMLYGSAYHLWFMYLIIGLYLFMPAISKIVKRISTFQFILFFILWTVSLIYIQYSELNSLLHLLLSTIGYIGYLLIGYIINKYKINERIRIRYASIIFIIGIITTLYLAYSQLNFTKNIQANTFHRLNLNIAFVSIGFFMMIKSFMFKHPLFIKISKNSFGIYYIHLFAIMFLNKLWVIQSSKYILISLVLFSLITFLLSYVLIENIEKLKSKIPFIKNLEIA